MISRNTSLFYWFAAAAVAVDQVTKILARHYLENRSITVIPGFFDLRLSYNTGAAFGILPSWTPFFIVIALVTIYAIVKFRQADGGSRPMSAGLGLLLGGAIGNLIDRLSSPARGVTDFLSFHVGGVARQLVYPTFNFADVAIVIGALFLFYSVYVVEKRKSETGAE